MIDITKLNSFCFSINTYKMKDGDLLHKYKIHCLLFCSKLLSGINPVR